VQFIEPIRGTHDLLEKDYEIHKKIIETLGVDATRYGFKGIQTPLIENIEVFKRSVGESSDIISKEMFSFLDRNEKEICLRPEGTAGVMRAVLSHKLTQNIPLKYFYSGPMFRYERPQKGRQRQFTQIGIEYIGESSFLADVECLSLAYYFLTHSLKIKDFTLELNTLGDLESRMAHKIAFKEYLERYRNHLSEDSQRRLESNPLRILDSKDSKDQEIVQGAPYLKDFLSSPSQAFFENVCQSLESLNIPYRLNPRLVRGLDYYSHTTFEFKSVELGAQDTILAGGRYDGLSEMLGGPHLPSVGWAAGVERLALLYQSTSSQGSLPKTFILPLGERELRDAFKIAEGLRSASVPTEIIYKPSLKAGLKQANKHNGQVAIILGEEERQIQQVTVKNLITGEQKRVSYLELTRYILDL